MGSNRRKQRWCSSSTNTHHQPLTPLMEGPDLEMQQEPSKKGSSWEAIREWFRVHHKGVSSMPGAPGHQSDDAAARSRSRSSTSISTSTSSRQGQDLRLLLGVLACPLAPIPLKLINSESDHHTISINNTVIGGDHHQLPPLISKHIPLETCSAHYIIQQYLAATGWSSKKQKIAKNMYVSGTVKMICCQKEVSSGSDYQRSGTSTSRSSGGGEKGCFVLWQMSPGMWSLELVVAGNKVLAGSDSKIVWRHTPWLGTHAAKGPQRPLRRIIQGLDPNSTASLFAGKGAQCLGEKRIGEEDCFVIKVAADRASVMERNEGPAAEVIRHVLYGYFSQRSGLLIYLEDSHLTRVLVHTPPNSHSHNHNKAAHHRHRHTNNEDDDDEDDDHPCGCQVAAVYWETTIGSSIGDYRDVDGVMIGHQGRTVATVFRFGETSSQHCRTTMEELWTIHDVVFDVPGLSVDCFIPPADIWDPHI